MRYEYIDVYDELSIVYYGMTNVGNGEPHSIPYQEDYKDLSVLSNVIGNSPMLF